MLDQVGGNGERRPDLGAAEDLLDFLTGHERGVEATGLRFAGAVRAGVRSGSARELLLGLVVAAVGSLLAWVAWESVNGVPLQDRYEVKVEVAADAPILKEGDSGPGRRPVRRADHRGRARRRARAGDRRAAARVRADRQRTRART